MPRKLVLETCPSANFAVYGFLWQRMLEKKFNDRPNSPRKHPDLRVEWNRGKDRGERCSPSRLVRRTAPIKLQGKGDPRVTQHAQGTLRIALINSRASRNPLAPHSVILICDLASSGLRGTVKVGVRRSYAKDATHSRPSASSSEG